jgi:hypothetical protein
MDDGRRRGPKAESATHAQAELRPALQALMWENIQMPSKLANPRLQAILLERREPEEKGHRTRGRRFLWLASRTVNAANSAGAEI